MRKGIVPACIALVLTVVVAVGSQSFLGPCVHDDGAFGACHWAGRMLLGLGCLMAALSLAALLTRDERFRAGLFLALLLTALLGVLTPGGLIALCGMSTMRCQALMKPTMRLLCAAEMLAAAAGWAAGLKKTK